MMLGKRARPPMKRTTSMTEFTLDLNGGAEGVYQPSDPNGSSDQRGLASSAARLHRRNSADFGQTANFLKVCSLCKRRLIPGRDIYMYRGDSAFCSLECRQQKMTQDERKEKRSSKPSSSTAAGNQVSSSATGETVAAL